MSAPPYMKLYWGDYSRKTRHLKTAREHGAYLLLIGALWDAGGRLPADDETLAQHALCSDKEWAAIKAKIMPFFRVSRGTISQQRVSEELAKYRDTSGKRKAAGKAGGSARSRKDRENDEAIARQLPTQSETESESETEKKEEPTGAQVLPFAGAEVGEVASPKRGTRLPADWRPSSADIAYAMREHGFSQAEAERIGESFRDYWHAVAGQKGVKLDWSATWRNWIRTEAERRPARRAGGGARPDWCD